MKFKCHTNIDLEGEVWPTELPELPKVGDVIESAIEHKNGHLKGRVALQVTEVRWKAAKQDFEPFASGRYDVWCPVLELGISKEFTSIGHFQDWHAYIRNKISKDEFQGRMSNRFSS
jgi:hypothetical protein